MTSFGAFDGVPVSRWPCRAADSHGVRPVRPPAYVSVPMDDCEQPAGG
jgi:hypothetical protein